MDWDYGVPFIDLNYLEVVCILSKIVEPIAIVGNANNALGTYSLVAILRLDKHVVAIDLDVSVGDSNHTALARIVVWEDCMVDYMASEEVYVDVEVGNFYEKVETRKEASIAVISEARFGIEIKASNKGGL